MIDANGKKVVAVAEVHPATGRVVRVRQNEGGKWSLCRGGEDGESGTVANVAALKNITVAYVTVRNAGGGLLATCGFALADVEAALGSPKQPKPSKPEADE